MHQPPSHARVMTWLAVFPLLLGCAERKASTAAPDAKDDAQGPASTSSPARCSGTGPSVAINLRGYAGAPEQQNEALGATLSWIGSFAQPCLADPPQAPRFTLEITIPEPGQAPSFELIDRDSLPGLAACLDEHFAQAEAPPPEPMMVEITIPWGCPTLGGGDVG